MDFAVIQNRPHARVLHLMVALLSIAGTLSCHSTISFAQGEKQPIDVKKNLQLSLEYLFEKQSKDGSWKSEYYGNLKQGAAITSLVLFSLSHVEPALLSENKKQIRKGFEYLRKGIAKHGFVANPDGPDYSNYSTALTLLAARKYSIIWKTEFLAKDERQKLIDFLIRSQLDEKHGMKVHDDDYGGWDLSGWIQEPRLSPGTNISISSFVLLALADEKGEAVEKVRSNSKRWILRLQNADHGFHFHPKKDHAGNKAEWIEEDPSRPRSYGTATVDGIRALRALKLPEKRIKSVAGWIVGHSGTKQVFEFVPGFESEGEVEALNRGQTPANKPDNPKTVVPDRNDQTWKRGLLFYYLMGLALEQHSFPESFQQKCREKIPAYLVSLQQKDGHWANTSSRMREDDPLIATPFAIIALAALSKKK